MLIFCDSLLTYQQHMLRCDSRKSTLSVRRSLATPSKVLRVYYKNPRRSPCWNPIKLISIARVKAITLNNSPISDGNVSSLI